MEEVKSTDMIAYLSCTMCMEELPNDMSPREYCNLEIGINIDNQMLIGCVRHEAHVGAFTLHEQVNMEAIERGCDCCNE
tara:strand:+ start:447 stop:683 length:237 start_codon:yes stop_codon:yes gene_type:complete